MGIVKILSSFVAGWLSDRISERLVIVQAFMIEGLDLFGLLQARGFPAFMAAMFKNMRYFFQKVSFILSNLIYNLIDYQILNTKNWTSGKFN